MVLCLSKNWPVTYQKRLRNHCFLLLLTCRLEAERCLASTDYDQWHEADFKNHLKTRYIQIGHLVKQYLYLTVVTFAWCVYLLWNRTQKVQGKIKKVVNWPICQACFLRSCWRLLGTLKWIMQLIFSNTKPCCRRCERVLYNFLETVEPVDVSTPWLIIVQSLVIPSWKMWMPGLTVTLSHWVS